jgi:hypothetical protein
MPKNVRPSSTIAILATVLLLGLAMVPILGETAPTTLAARPTPTYVSELAPAVSVAPRPAASLPATGGAVDVRDAVPTAKIAGLALALVGLVMIHVGLRRGASRAT